MYAKKLTAFFLILALVISCFAMVPVISASAEEPKAQMIVFDQPGTYGVTPSNILLPLNLASGGKYKLTFKMRRLSGSGAPIIGSVRTTGSGNGFPSADDDLYVNNNNSLTPDADGYYTYYDESSYTFTAVLNIQRYGSETSQGANCFITIGNARHVQNTVDGTNYGISFAMAEPRLYKLDGSGNPTGGNLAPAINSETLALGSKYAYKHQATCGWNTGAPLNKWSSDTKNLRCFADKIPAGFFTSGYTIDINSRMFCLTGGNYAKFRFNFCAESETSYMLRYKYRSKGDEGYVSLVQSPGNVPVSFTESDDSDTYTKSLRFTTMADLENISVYFGNGANGIDKKFYISGLELYKTDGSGNPTGENLIAAMNPVFGDTGDVSYDPWHNITSPNAYWYSVYDGDAAGDSTFDGDLKVLDVPEGFFTYLTYLQRFEFLRETILRLISPDPSNLYCDPNFDAFTDIKDIVSLKKHAVRQLNNWEGGADDLAAAKRNAIINSSKALYGENTVYYVDSENGSDSKNGLSQANAKKTLAGLAGLNPASGDTVLFKRGGVYRMPAGGNSETAAINFKAGVRYGVYGDESLAKPLLSGSVYNYATRSWTNVSGNIWRTNIKNQDGSSYRNADEVGSVYLISSGGVITTGKMAQTGTSELAAPGDFYDAKDGYVYVYSAGNPASVYADIEIAQHRNVVTINSGVQVDNLKIAFGGMHGISGTKRSNVTITNCEIAYIGGTWLTESRAGNGIQFGLGASNITVTNNYVHDCYDAGITFQTWESTSDMGYNNLTFNDNLIECCWYNFEFFTFAGDTLNNINISNNIMRKACFGIFEREDRVGYLESNVYMGAHIRCGRDYYYPNTTDFTITNNIFDCSKESLIYWNWYNVEGSADAHPGLTLSGNTYYQKSGATEGRVMWFGKTGNFAYASSKQGLVDAVAAMETSPKSVEWLNNIR